MRTRAEQLADASSRTMEWVWDEAYDTGYQEGGRSEAASFDFWMDEVLDLEDRAHVERVVAFVRGLTAERMDWTPQSEGEQGEMAAVERIAAQAQRVLDAHGEHSTP